MWIKLFFRHLFKSIKNRPLQPLLSVLILALSFFLSSSALNVSHWLREESSERQAATYGNAVIAVTLNGQSENRFLQTEDVYAALGDGVTAAGLYELPLYCGGSLAPAVAVDFEEIGAVFALEFSSYGIITPETKDETALISASFAEKYSLSVGESFQSDVLGYTKTYTVQGISEREFMGTYSVMVSVSGMIRLFAEDSPFIASLGDGFRIYSRLYITAEKELAPSLAATLREYPAFADKTVSVVSDLLVMQANLKPLSSLIFILVLFIGFLAATVIFCCFYILSNQRAQENTLFMLSGVPPRTLLFLQCSEIFLYWLVGGILGMAAVCLFSPPLVNLCGFRYIAAVFGGAFWWNGVKGLGITLTTALLTALFFALSERNKEKKSVREKRSIAPILIFLTAATAVMLVCSVVTPVKLHIVFAVLCAIFFLSLVFLGMPPLFQFIMERLSRFLEREKKDTRKAAQSRPSRVCLRYAAKNARKVKTLHNSCRLASLLLSVSAALAATLIGGFHYVNALQNIFSTDYMVLNVSEKTAAEIEACEGVQAVYPVYWNTALDGEGNAVQVISITDWSVLSDVFRPDELPKGREAVLSKAYAGFMNVSVGDEISVTVDSYELTFTVSTLFNSPLSCIYFDCSSFGISYNILSVSGEEGTVQSELEGNIAAAMKLEMAVIVSTDEFMEQKKSMFTVYLRSGELLFVSLVIFSLTGLIDNLFESYRSRREEFGLYRNSGMTNRQVVCMKSDEIGMTLAVSLLAGALFFCFIMIILNQWLQSLSVDLFFLLFFC